jgi:recombinational DNA repair protein RecT
MSTEISTPAKQTGLVAWVSNPDAHARIAAAVGDVIDADTFIAHMMTAFQSPEIKHCTDQSKYTALHECAALGLLPTLNQVRLIPYKDQLKAMPQWQGFKALMERHPAILEVCGVLVHKKDTYKTENGEFIHNYDPFDETREFKSVADLVGGYCKIVYRDGRPPKYHMVTAKHIAKAQACAQTQNVWSKWYEQMALKTLYRDCYARRAVPIDPLVYGRLQAAIDIDDVQLGNSPLQIDSNAREIADTLTKKAEAKEPEKEAPREEPKLEPIVEPEPQTVTTPIEEQETIDEWMSAIKDEDNPATLKDWLTKIPPMSEAGKLAITSRIEMRIVELGAKKTAKQKTFEA